MPRCDTEAMNLYLAEIATQIAPGAHAAILLDQAGWHLSRKLEVPANITLIPLPAKCPELNPQENVWQFMRENWLSNRVFTSYQQIVDLCCDAWNSLVDQPWRIMSIGTRQWPTGSNHRVLVLAPTQPPFAVTQGVVLLAFIPLGVWAAVRFRPEAEARA